MRIGDIAIAGLLLTAAAPAGFSFRAIEFAPPEARLPAARAFIAHVAAPGTPLPVAVRAIERAEASCRKPRGPDAAIVCLSSRPVQRSDEASLLDDVTWTVRLVPAANGAVATATVVRGRYGS